ncbi:SRPBCC family protein [Serratia inhibens]|uniref:SRPBCC family protein n=1 Tax=Serratia inhibens TaxID=2338073 RepID=UPI003217981C
MESTVASLVISRDIEEVWAIIEKFHALSAWHPAVVNSEFEEGYTEDAVGAVRRVTLGNGASGTEKLIRKDSKSYVLTYSFETAPLPVENYLSTIQLLPTRNPGNTHVVWSASFNCKPDLCSEMRRVLENDVYLAGIKALQTETV